MKFCFCSSIINHPSHYQEAGLVSMVEKKNCWLFHEIFFVVGGEFLDSNYSLKINKT